MRVFAAGILLVSSLGIAPVYAMAPPRCASLQGMKIGPAAIGLPTSGAVVETARIFRATGTGDTLAVEHCEVSGAIKPVDRTAPDIKFEVDLPPNWNGKALMVGGGGFNGHIPNLTKRIEVTPDSDPSPLAQGYAVFGSDSGHEENKSHLGSFMSNAEALSNYRGDALKKTHDVALIMIKAAYGRSPQKAYFWGGSTGGREGLLAAGRWPKDWDGVVSRYPALHLITSLLGGHHVARALAQPGGWLNPEKRAALFHAALQACDALDGAKDGVISNVKGCYAKFNPATAMLNGAPLRCPGGVDTGNSCLSDAQLRTLAQINAGVHFNFRLASGDLGHPGYNVYTSDNGMPGTSRIERGVSAVSFGDAPPGFPVTAKMPYGYAGYEDDFFRYAVGHGNPAFNSLTIDPANPGPYAAKLSEMSAPDSQDLNLAAFAAHGGKLLLIQGLADTIISARMTEWYYAQLQKKLGANKVASFVRFYEIAGWNHGFSPSFNASWDTVETLDNWVENGTDPGEHLVVFDTAGVPGRSRPLCLYPRWPKYKGFGDINAASSFSCATH